MKAKVNNDKQGEEVTDDGWTDYFMPEMRSNRTLRFEKHPNLKNWYVCSSKTKTYSEDLDLKVSLKGLNYHISWLIPVEENEKS